MENFKNNTCCIIGHKNILVTNELINKLELVIESLILHFNVTIFLFGSKSEFNDLCYRIVSELKCKHNYIKRVNYPCKGEFYILEQEKDYYENLFKQINKNKININSFDEIILIEEIFKGYKSSYIKRNFKMINESAYGLFYYLEDYVPMQKKERTLCF